MRFLLNSLLKMALLHMFVLVVTQVSAQQTEIPVTGKLLVRDPGLEIDQNTLVRKITDFDSSMVFKPKEYATVGVDKYNSRVEILSNQYSLISAKWTFVFSKSDIINLNELTEMGHFAFIMGQNQCVEWFKSQIIAAEKDITRDINVTKLFNGRKATTIYNFKSGSFTLSFTELYN